MTINGKPHHYIEVEVSACSEKEWLELKDDWVSHGGCNDDPEGRKRNLDRKEKYKISYRTVFYFNISDFF